MGSFKSVAELQRRVHPALMPTAPFATPKHIAIYTYSRMFHALTTQHWVAAHARLAPVQAVAVPFAMTLCPVGHVKVSQVGAA